MVHYDLTVAFNCLGLFTTDCFSLTGISHMLGSHQWYTTREDCQKDNFIQKQEMTILTQK